MTTTIHPKLHFGFVLLLAALVAWGSPATAEECGSPCTVTRAGLPTFRLVNTVSGAFDWDLETSAFGVELAHWSDSPSTGVFRVDHDANANSLVIDGSGRIGINTSVPTHELQINGTSPEIVLDDISSGAGKGAIRMSDNNLTLGGDNGQMIVDIDTRAGSAVLLITDSGDVAIGGFANPQARLHVNGDLRVNSGARIDGDVALGSSRALKTDFGAVDPAEVLARLADLSVASWRYKSEDESARHIGPFAEDFQRLFGLGDGETISLVDAQGVALAAIQGVDGRLDREVAALRAGIASLSETNRRLANENADLRNRLETIEEALGQLGSAWSGPRRAPSEGVPAPTPATIGRGEGGGWTGTPTTGGLP